MDFFDKTDICHWTCKNVIKYYKEKNTESNFKQVLDKINRDVKQIAASGTDSSRRKKAQSILDNWKVIFILFY